MTDCHYCGAKMVWRQDVDASSYFDDPTEVGIVSILECTKCGCTAIFKTKEGEE